MILLKTTSWKSVEWKKLMVNGRELPPSDEKDNEYVVITSKCTMVKILLMNYLKICSCSYQRTKSKMDDYEGFH
jgi:hypothetical protein